MSNLFGKKSSPAKRASPAKRSGGKKSPAKNAAPAAAKQQFPDWWIRCKKCGHVPRSTPQMACSSCKEVHGKWSPDPMPHIVKVAHEVRGIEAKVKTTQANVAQMRSNNADLAAEVRALQVKVQDDEAVKEQAGLEAEALELERMGKGPGTKAREQTLVSNANRRMILLKTRVDEAEEDLRDIETQIAAAEAQKRDLQRKQSDLQRDRSNLQAENDRMRTAVVNAAARR